MDNQKRIAIIGAGWTGIGCLRILRDKGYQVDVYEQNDSVGGTWHPSNHYAGLKLHSCACTIEYHDFPLPDSVDRYERLHSCQVYNYVNDYCDYFSLKENIQFHKIVKKIHYCSKSKKSIITYCDQNNMTMESPEYDYVIYTHGYTEKKIPDFKHQAKFKGELLHSFTVSEQNLKKMMAANKKIVIVGASKSATDFIIKISDHGYKVRWLVRKPYWFFNYSLRKKWLKEPKNHLFHKTVFLSGLILANFLPAFSLRFWSWFRLIKTYQKNNNSFKSFHFGMIDESQFKILEHYYRDHGVYGEIAEFTEHGIILDNGKKYAVDAVICCTGSGPTAVNIVLEIDGQPFDTANVNKMYRSKVIPEIPNLIFTAYHQFSIGTVDGLLQGNWVETYIQAELKPEYLNQNATLFSKPFFSKAPLFDSENYLIQTIGKMYYPYFANKELSTLSFIKWFIDSTFNGRKKIIPFEFKNSR